MIILMKRHKKPMDSTKQKQLEKAGWKVGTTQQFLGLSDQEAAVVEMRLALATSLKARRLKLKLTQVQLAGSLKTSQSRIAKMEAGDASVTIDHLIRAILSLGANRQDIGRILSKKITA
jgi:DNA-directed RNA polymerase sigma subunit (sigma70/sigma32)